MPASPSPLIETLEDRTVLSAGAPLVSEMDGGGTFAAARSVGQRSGSLVVNNALARREFADYFSFSVNTRGNVNLTLNNLTADADLRLYDADGDTITTSSASGAAAEHISRSLNAGAYVARVSRGVDAAAGTIIPYALGIQADLNYETVRIDGAHYTLGLIKADRTTNAVLPGRETWVAIHGWRDAPTDVHRVATAIDAAPGRNQVFEVDWSPAAASTDTNAVALRVPEVGAWVAKKLTSWGIAGQNVNLVGHSYGAYMADEIAMRIPGGVNRVVALDTAIPAIAGTDRENVNFAAHSKYAVAFVGSAFAHQAVSRTADQTILLDVGDFSQGQSHTNVREFFANVLQRDTSANPDRISNLFGVDTIGSSAARPFLRDGLGNGYEARIVAKTLFPTTLTYVDAFSRKTIVLSA